MELIDILTDKTAAGYAMWDAVPGDAVATFQREIEPKLRAATTVKESRKVLEALGETINMLPGNYPGGIPNSPSPLGSMLVGGMSGAGLGYLGGMAGEALLPRTWQRGNLRRTLAILGGLMGAAPGATWGAVNANDGRSFNDDTLTKGKIDDGKSISFKTSAEKMALLSGTGAGAPIDVNRFNYMLYQDPLVSNRLDPRLQAAASGMVTGAAHLPGKSNTRMVTPMDMGRMAAGMGSGYLAGAVVGKILGVAMGMPRETQTKFRQTGAMAGMIANLVPIVFGA
jgi:hypothetical protein